ncbi:TolB family protein, partial [candidate division KSB1 bacterium]
MSSSHVDEARLMSGNHSVVQTQQHAPGLSIPALIAILFFACGGTTNPRLEPNLPVELEEGINPDWLPDNSAVTSIFNYNLENYPWETQHARGGYIQFRKTGGELGFWRSRISPGGVFYHAWSNEASGRNLVYVADSITGGYSLYQLDQTSGESIELFTAEKAIMWPSWSADNSKIAFINLDERNGITVVNSNGSGGAKVIDNTIDWGGIKFARCACHAPYIVYVSRHLDKIGIYSIGLAGGAPEILVEIENPTAMIHSAELSPDGSVLAYTSDDTRDPQFRQPVIYLKMLPDGEPRAITSNLMLTKNYTRRYYLRHWLHLAWAPDGRTIVCEA